MSDGAVFGYDECIPGGSAAHERAMTLQFRLVGRALPALLLLSSTFACGTSTEEDEADSDDAAIRNGVATTERSNTVGKLVMSSLRSDGSREYQNACTGTLVAPDVVVTGKDCFTYRPAVWELFNRGPRWLAMSFQLPGRVGLGKTWSYLGGSPGIVLVKLHDAVQDGEPVRAATKGAREGDAVTIFGFGCNASARDGNVLRRATVKWGDWWGSWFGWVGRSGECDGDLGAPVFDARGGIVAVLSRTENGTFVMGGGSFTKMPTNDARNVASEIETQLRAWERAAD
jgi:hypothetical protein